MVAHTQFAVSVMVMEARAKTSVRKLVEERTQNGLCLIPDCDCEAHKRGLCQYHYGQYYFERISKSPAARIEFELEQIREGRLLGFRECRKRKVVNPFRSAS